MIERFVEEYSERGFQFAYHLCGNAEEAKELVQEAFVRLIRRWDQFDQGQPLENWFLTILKNVYFDGLRRYERRHGVSLDEPSSSSEGAEPAVERLADGSESLLEALERAEAAEAVRDALEALRPDHRAILQLSDMQGMPYEQIAVVLDCPVGTVKSRLNRARAALRRRLAGSPILEVKG